MKTIHHTRDAGHKHRGFGARLLAAALLLGMSSLAQAAPLNLMLLPEPDIFSEFITVNYDEGTDSLTAAGTARTLTTGGSSPDIVGGSFDLMATVDDGGNLSNGMLTIGGTVAGLGFNSGTLLTGNLTAIGFNMANDPLEFLFDVTGGDAAGLYGSLGGIILNQAGFGGTWTTFNSGPALANADVGVVPVPAAVWLFGSALLGLLGFNVRKKNQAGA